jgi:hypothetical protein
LFKCFQKLSSEILNCILLIIWVTNQVLSICQSLVIFSSILFLVWNVNVILFNLNLWWWNSVGFLYFIIIWELKVNLLDFVGWFFWNKVVGTEILGDFCITFYIWHQWSWQISHRRYCFSTLMCTIFLWS